MKVYMTPIILCSPKLNLMAVSLRVGRGTQRSEGTSCAIAKGGDDLPILRFTAIKLRATTKKLNLVALIRRLLKRNWPDQIASG
jgi:hypothetical protein